HGPAHAQPGQPRAESGSEHLARGGEPHQRHTLWATGPLRSGRSAGSRQACPAICGRRRTVRGAAIMIFADMDWALIGEATLDPLLMTGFSLVFTVLIGLPLGIVLFLTSKHQMLEN